MIISNTRNCSSNNKLLFSQTNSNICVTVVEIKHLSRLYEWMGIVTKQIYITKVVTTLAFVQIAIYELLPLVFLINLWNNIFLT